MSDEEIEFAKEIVGGLKNMGAVQGMASNSKTRPFPGFVPDNPVGDHLPSEFDGIPVVDVSKRSPKAIIKPIPSGVKEESKQPQLSKQAIPQVSEDPNQLVLDFGDKRRVEAFEEILYSIEGKLESLSSKVNMILKYIAKNEI